MRLGSGWFQAFTRTRRVPRMQWSNRVWTSGRVAAAILAADTAFDHRIMRVVLLETFRGKLPATRLRVWIAFGVSDLVGREEVINALTAGTSPLVDSLRCKRSAFFFEGVAGGSRR